MNKKTYSKWNLVPGTNLNAVAIFHNRSSKIQDKGPSKKGN